MTDVSTIPVSDDPLHAITCSMCGEQKGETNHWWLLWVWRADEEIEESVHAPATLMIAQWTKEAAQYADQNPACGSICAHKLMERFLSTGSLAPSSRPAAESTTRAEMSNG